MSEEGEAEHLLASLRGEGELDSEGVFSENLPAMFERLSQRLFQEGDEYLLCFLQAFCVAGARSIVYEASSSWIELRSEQGRLPMLPRDRWPALALDSSAGAARYLAAGLVGAWSVHPEILVESGRESRVYRPEQGLAPETRPARLSGIRIVLYRARSVMRASRPAQPRLLAFPVPIHLPSLLGGRTAVLQDRSYGASGLPLLLPDGAGRLGGILAMGHGGLGVPVTLAGAPVVWHGEDELQPLRINWVGGNSWYATGRFLLFRQPLSGPSYLVAVDAGVALRPLPVELGCPGLVLVVPLQGEGLSSDLSGSQLRVDAALEGCLERVRVALPDWLRLFSEGVERWKPPVYHDQNALPGAGAGLLGFMGGMLVFAATGVFLPPILALGGAYAGDRAYVRWKKRGITSQVRSVLAGRDVDGGTPEPGV